MSNLIYRVVMPDESVVIITEEEYPELKKALDYMGLDYQASVIQEKMYSILWYDYLDEVLSMIWCTEEEFEDKLQEVIDAGVKYEVTEYN